MTQGSTRSRPRQGLMFLRLMMTLSSLSPIFILWAVRGVPIFPNTLVISICTAMVIFPSLFLWIRIRVAKKQNDRKCIFVGAVEDHSTHVLVYLFSVLLPLFMEEVTTYRDFAGMIVAFVFIVILFFRLNLHYINILFLFLGYRTFMISSPMDGNPHTGREPFILITHRNYLKSNDSLTAYRVSDTVYLECTT